MWNLELNVRLYFSILTGEHLYGFLDSLRVIFSPNSHFSVPKPCAMQSMILNVCKYSNP